MIPEILKSYQAHIEERQKSGIPPLPLNAQQVKALSELVFDPPAGYEDLILKLLKDHIPPGVDPAALEKAHILRKIALKERGSKLLTPSQAISLLGLMKGGYNIETLIELLDEEEFSDEAVHALSNTILIFGFFERIKELSATNPNAQKVLESWAKAEWFERDRKSPKPAKLPYSKS
jgi:aconitate hydratase 2/2-methylisocitrate dehydratase